MEKTSGVRKKRLTSAFWFMIATFMGRQPAHNLTPRQPRRGLRNEMK
jgi:hypothetical protein